MPTMRSSIALATFNGERFLQAQLESLATQTTLPDELVVADDGSTDATIDIVEDFARHAPFPVHLSRNTSRLGHKANFMQVSGRCSGDWIFFCDQDDVWVPEKIARVLEAVTAGSTLLVFHQSWITTAALEQLRPFWSDTDRAEREADLDRTPWGWCPGYSQAVHRDLLAFNDLWPLSVQPGVGGPLAHDAWFFFVACGLQATRYVDRSLVHYRQHESNAVGFAPSSTLVDKVLAKSGTPGRWDRHAALAATARANLLREALDRRPSRPEVATRIGHYADSYDAMAARLTRRVEMAGSTSRLRRLALLAQHLRLGDYGWKDAWRFTPAGFARDVCSALLASAPSTDLRHAK